jgi:hypothetical protein
VVITDYPDIELIDNIRYNVSNCGIGTDIQERISVEGYLWGNDAEPLLSHLGNNSKFNIVIMSDTVSTSSICQVLIYRYLIIPNINRLLNLLSSTSKGTWIQEHMSSIPITVHGSKQEIFSSLISRLKKDL